MPTTVLRVVWTENAVSPSVRTITAQSTPTGECDQCHREFDAKSLFEGLYGGHTVCGECLWTHPGGDENT
ncbi:MAG: hypothetical protein QF752_04610 [Planctomycetota bacterium]|jgi:hypothetical protein|nr:hypothetical protein [Planctomycetota bacterium]